MISVVVTAVRLTLYPQFDADFFVEFVDPLMANLNYSFIIMSQSKLALSSSDAVSKHLSGSAM